MFDPNNPLQPQMPGQVHTMNALMPTGPNGGQAGAQIGGDQVKNNAWRQQYHNALMDWRQGFNPATMNMQDYRATRPDRHDFRPGAVPGNTGIVPPQLPNTQMPAQPQMLPPQQMPGMVGQSYGVQGMTPAANPYGLPTY